MSYFNAASRVRACLTRIWHTTANKLLRCQVSGCTCPFFNGTGNNCANCGHPRGTH